MYENAERWWLPDPRIDTRHALEVLRSALGCPFWSTLTIAAHMMVRLAYAHLVSWAVEAYAMASRPLVVVLIIGAVMFVLSPVPSFAGTAYGDWRSAGPFVGGYSYRHRSIVDTDRPSGADNVGEVQVQLTSGQLVAPAGYFGARPEIHYGDGALCWRNQHYTYTDIPASNIVVSTPHACGSGPVYYAEGRATFWNGSNYVTTATLRSPSQNS